MLEPSGDVIVPPLGRSIKYVVETTGDAVVAPKAPQSAQMQDSISDNQTATFPKVCYDATEIKPNIKK